MRHIIVRVVFVILSAAILNGAQCRKGGSDDAVIPSGPPAGWELGSGDHTPGSVTFTTVAAGADGLSTPRDLAFNPNVPGQLWVVNYTNASVLIIGNATSASPTYLLRQDSNAGHFMPFPSALAFGGNTTTFGLPGTFATSAESNNGGNYFMGPTLWSSDLSVFAVQNPFGLGSHIDMLHCSPYGMGIAWEANNVFWVFGGYTNDIMRYDFQVDHGIGMDDHSDGVKYHYCTGLVLRQIGVPSHLSLDPATKKLYICDTGNSRLAVLDTLSGTVGGNHAGPDPVITDKYVTGASLTTLVGSLNKPSGCEFHNGLIYISEYGTGVISAYTPAGVKVNWIDTGLGANKVMGMNFGPDGKLYFVDAGTSRVLRITP